MTSYRYPFTPLAQHAVERAEIEMKFSRWGYDAVIWTDLYGNYDELSGIVTRDGVNSLFDSIPASRWMAIGLPSFDTEYWMPLKLKYAES